VDVETTGSYENEAEEIFTDTTAVVGEGSSKIDLGLSPLVPAACGDPEVGGGDQDSSDDDDDEGDGTVSSISKRRTTPIAESALEDKCSKQRIHRLKNLDFEFRFTLF